MALRTLSHLYRTYDEAVQAVYDLEQAGIPSGDISLIGADSDPRVTNAVTNDSAEAPVSLGAKIGATAGGGVGVLAGIGAILIPGIGPLVAAGWFIAGLTGAGVGAAAGGLVGALTHLGVTNDQAHLAKEGLQRGGTLVMVRAEYDWAERVEAILARNHQTDAAQFERQSPIVEMAETASTPTQGDYSDELARIEAARQRIEQGE